MKTVTNTIKYLLLVPATACLLLGVYALRSDQPKYVFILLWFFAFLFALPKLLEGLFSNSEVE